jgi:hypothetical protein
MSRSSIHLEKRSGDRNGARAGGGAADRRAGGSREAELTLLEKGRRAGSSDRGRSGDGAELTLLEGERRRAGRSSARGGSSARRSGLEARRGRREEGVVALVDDSAGSSGSGRGGRAENLTLVDGGAAGGSRGAAELALVEDGRAGRNSRRGGSSRARESRRQFKRSGSSFKDLRLREGDSSAQETSESKTGELHFVDVVVTRVVILDKIEV